MKNPLKYSNPLFLPEGSIRAIIALIIVVTICILSIIGVEHKELFLILSSITGFYFGAATKRKKEK